MSPNRTDLITVYYSFSEAGEASIPGLGSRSRVGEKPGGICYKALRVYASYPGHLNDDHF